MDTAIAQTLRGLGILILITYVCVVFAMFASVKRYYYKVSWYSPFVWVDFLSLFLYASAAFGAILYVLVLTLIARNRPSTVLAGRAGGWLFSSGSSSNNNGNMAILVERARKFIIVDPNDPLAEPLLVV